MQRMRRRLLIVSRLLASSPPLPKKIGRVTFSGDARRRASRKWS